jgi:hypothetical protein
MLLKPEIQASPRTVIIKNSNTIFLYTTLGFQFVGKSNNHPENC